MCVCSALASCGARTELDTQFTAQPPPNRADFVGRWTGSLQTFHGLPRPFCNNAPVPSPNPREFYPNGCTVEVQPAENPTELWTQIIFGDNLHFEAALEDNDLPRHYLRVQTSLRATFNGGFNGYDGGGTVVEEYNGTMTIRGDTLVLQLCFRTGLVNQPPSAPSGVECRLRRIR